MDTTELEPSRLGTKAHWDHVYEEEVANFTDTGDEGEIWFGEDSVDKMVDWASKYVPPTSHPHVLEVGSGNGTLLLALVDAGFDASKLAGVDYSPDAVKLAQMIASTRNGELVSFSVCDFLTEVPPPPSKTTDAWDLILDKGTYDAIALGEKDADGRSPASGYPVRVSNLLKENGFFLITSCNFTEEELKKNFITLETGLKYHSRINHPTISFGGKSGSVYATVAFQKI